jgi:hypothetical protein
MFVTKVHVLALSFSLFLYHRLTNQLQKLNPPCRHTLSQSPPLRENNT